MIPRDDCSVIAGLIIEGNEELFYADTINV